MPCSVQGQANELSFYMTTIAAVSDILLQAKTPTFLSLIKMSANIPWKNGYYLSNIDNRFLHEVNRNQSKLLNLVSFDFPDIANEIGTATWTFGDFGKAQEKVIEASGGTRKNYNVEIVAMGGLRKSLGIINENGDTIFAWGTWNCLELIEWKSEDEIKTLLESRDSFEEPECLQYEIKPNLQHSLIWLSGPPGAGKSTTGALLAKDNEDFVYYEADCTCNCVNPFINPKSKNPGKEAFQQKPMKIPREFAESMGSFRDCCKLLAQGRFAEIDYDSMNPMLMELAKHISMQQRRIGGRFIVAQAAMNRNQRDTIRSVIPDCIFITLTLSRETQEKRVRARHGDEAEGILKFLTMIYDKYELPEKGEENAFNVDITPDDNPEDVVHKVLDMLLLSKTQ